MGHEVIGRIPRLSCESGAGPRWTGVRLATSLLLLAVLSLLVTWPSVAAPPSKAPSAGAPSEPTPPPKPPAPASIPVPEVARQAEEVAKTLRDIDALMAPGTAIESVERRMPDISARIEAQTKVTQRQLDEQPSGATLDALTALWQTTRVEMAGYLDLLTRKATDLEGAMKSLTSLRETWNQTRVDARASRAPAPVLERIDSVLGAIDATVGRLQRQRGITLVLQDRLAQEVASAEGVLVRIADLRQGLGRRLLVSERPPIWQIEWLRDEFAELPDRMGEVVADHVAQVRQGVQNQRWRIAGQIVLLIGLALVMGAARRRAHEWSAERDVTPGLRVFERPVAAAALLTLLTSGWFYSPPPPRPAMALGQVLARVLALRIMHLLVQPRRWRGLYVFGAFFLTDLIRSYVSPIPLLERSEARREGK